MSDTIIWTSGTDLGSEGHFYWSSTGKDFTSAAPWRSIPNNINNNEHCVELFYDKELNDNDCKTRHSYICYRNETIVEENKKFEVIKNDRAYIIDYQKLNWYMAEKNCKKYKMKLLTVTDDVEMIKKIMMEAHIGDHSLWLSDLNLRSKDALMFGTNNSEFHIQDVFDEKNCDICAFLRNYYGNLYQDDKNCLDEHLFICVGSLKNDLKNVDVRLKPFWAINVIVMFVLIVSKIM